jgi:CheY-like chemotaxis protein/anti-sigma regulatory factor (Ser/Thr protein kinase)
VAKDVFDLAATLTGVEETLHVRAEAKGPRFVVDRSAGLARYVLGDAHHLRQVLTNLLGNAIKYTDHGRIGLRAQAESDGRVRFEVSDTGPGIAEEEQEKIFTAFYQTDLGLAKGEGTGLGLTIAREFVRLMGGKLSVASEPGKGSSFAFAIPLPASDAIPGAVGARHVIGLADGQAAPRVLVAEDQADNRQFLEALLTQVGFEVRTVDDGRQAIEGFETWQPQVILMDMRMPVMDGFAATRAIRRMPGGDKIPIIAVTASAMEAERDLVIGAGCDDLVRKPIDEDHLFKVLARVLGLEFRYAELAAESGAPGAAQSLAALPQGEREALAEAAAMLDREATLAIVERLGADHPTEARLIADLVAGYRFDRIEALTRLDDAGADGGAALRGMDDSGG